MARRQQSAKSSPEHTITLVYLRGKKWDFYMIKSQFIQIETIEVNLLAHKTGKPKELRLISGMSRSECSNKVIGFDLLVFFVSLT